MDDKRFDDLTRTASATRRGALRALAAVLIGPLAGLVLVDTGAGAAEGGERNTAVGGGGGGKKRRKRHDRCEPKSRRRLCGNRCGRTSDGCGGHVDCGGCGRGEACRGGRCVKAACKPSCGGKQCGSDGCGGGCGTCPKGRRCAANGRCVAASCVPKTCADLGAECGTANDGCGGTLSCGSCGDDKVCEKGRCKDGPCTPDCRDKDCGADGCGGDCGACAGPQDSCQNGQCVCNPACKDKACGDDGCGGACGACSVCEECRPDGTCRPLPDGTVCGERADFGGTLRCCKGVCPTPTCLPAGQPCPGGDCDACCNPGDVVTPIIGYCRTGTDARCPNPAQGEDFGATCPPAFQCPGPQPGCRPCFGAPDCQPGVTGGGGGSGCGSDADCKTPQSRCQCGRCCLPAGAPSTPCSHCCSGACDPQNPGVCA